ncbi:hypothetical protein [Hyphomicrobium sp. D-2]|uniref:hypothetical protein n=1 Tax=Hyphomicrobium sp. D-2 TaxID=3041621 RepID=UPI002454846E|nr:hypothetical protein [Hyphomicrobium sp. D-2]MDH4981201.1 hypothetical protein [Hyphomicrobium sp. D-2]
MPIISWLLRPILFISAVIAGWFVSTDAANFGVVQMAVSVLVIAALVGLAAFWQPIALWFRNLIK